MYDTDQEQIEAMKAWWLKNGNWVIAGCLVFIASYVGFLWFQNHNQQQQLAASTAYDQLLLNVSSETPDPIERQGLSALLKAEYAGMGYGAMAALIEARAAVDAGDLELALTELSWAQSNADEALMSVILYRKATVQYALGELDTALTTIESISASGHDVLTAELKGDILLEQGDVDLARSAYQAAVDASAEQNISNPYLQIKLNDIAVSE